MKNFRKNINSHSLKTSIGFPVFNFPIFSIFQFFQSFNLLLFLFLILNPSFIISQNTLDNLTYNYKANTNQLKYITDVAGSVIPGVDLDNQTNNNNYTYNANGQLIKDVAEGILDIDWTASGKVKQVNIDDNGDLMADRTLQFVYDEMDNRIKKTETNLTTNSPILTTYYMRNATGELISVYEDEGSGVERKELNIAVGTDKAASESITNGVYSRNVGFKNYELKDHLGNVRVVINDVKEPNLGAATFTSNIKQATDYYSYGMQMPGRSLSAAEGYRYGYQGKEKDDELKGNGNSYDFGARLLDPRVGRWLSLDPLDNKFPSMSPYNAMGNNPIAYVDPDGKKIKFASGSTAEFKAATNLTIEYLKAQGLGADIEAIEKSKYTVYLKEGNSPCAQAWQNPVTKNLTYAILYWNPNLGLAIEDDAGRLTGEAISPAVVLAHELAHVGHMFSDYAKFQLDNDPKTGAIGDALDNREEGHAILIDEHNAAQKLNESFRYNHRGSLYVTQGPLSSEAFDGHAAGTSSLSIPSQLKIANTLSPLGVGTIISQAQSELEINNAWKQSTGENFYKKGQINAGIFSRTEGGVAEKLIEDPIR